MNPLRLRLRFQWLVTLMMILACLVGWPMAGLSQVQTTLSKLGKGIEFPSNSEWLNVSKPLQLQELKGKLVLLDFWTYCCINCMHVLPVLKQAENQFSKHLVVVGVHTAKFETERDTENIREAVLRYEIHHPVLNDREQVLWKGYGVNTWPTLLLLDPEGNVIWSHKGEIPYKDLEKILNKAVAKYQGKGLDDKPFQASLESAKLAATPLRFPGKILADEAGKRLFIADTNHNRIVVTDLDGKLIKVIGSGVYGANDGTLENAEFRHPQGMALVGASASNREQLYVADTENHLIRRVDLQAGEVTTVAGTGQQSTSAFPGNDKGGKLPKKLGRKPRSTPIASPWDLWWSGEHLYIAMAGPHQIWRMDTEEKSIGPYAGNGREDIVDGPLIPSQAYALDACSFAQPSGLASDGKNLFVADSEGSSIRVVPLDGKSSVTTLIGTSNLPSRRLFTFGDRDGATTQSLLQHPLGVAFHRNKLYVVDTYNNKVKVVDMSKGQVTSLIGGPKSGASDSPPLLDEPSGLAVAGNRLYIADTNNHAIRVWDLDTETLSTMAIAGLTEPSTARQAPSTPKLPSDATPSLQPTLQVSQDAKEAVIQVSLEMPPDWKLNAESPLGYVLQQRDQANGKVLQPATRQLVTPPQVEFTVSVPLAKQCGYIELAVTYYYCQSDGAGVCLADSVLLQIPVERGTKKTAPYRAQYAVPSP